MAYTITGPIGPPLGQTGAGTGAQGIDATSTVQNYALGTRVRAFDPTYGEAEFVYGKGVASTVVGSAVHIKGDFTTALAAAQGIGLVGVAMSANVANQYGWYCISGVVPVKAGTVAAAGQAYLTATAGTLDDAAVTGDAVMGAGFYTADGTPSAGLAMLSLFYAVTGHTDNA